MADSPFADLRRAAATLRRLATAATPGPWQRDEHGVTACGFRALTVPGVTDATGADSDLIAVMDPTVATALSDLLDTAAEAVWPGIVGPHHQYWRLALTVARAVNAKEGDRD